MPLFYSSNLPGTTESVSCSLDFYSHAFLSNSLCVVMTWCFLHQTTCPVATFLQSLESFSRTSLTVEGDVIDAAWPVQRAAFCLVQGRTCRDSSSGWQLWPLRGACWRTWRTVPPWASDVQILSVSQESALNKRCCGRRNPPCCERFCPDRIGSCQPGGAGTPRHEERLLLTGRSFRLEPFRRMKSSDKTESSTRLKQKSSWTSKITRFKILIMFYFCFFFKSC